MIRDHMEIWLLRPGFTLEQFGKLPEWLDETDERPGAEQLGERWQPIEGLWRLEGSALHGDGQAHELLGAIHLRCELMMLFEDNLVAFVQSDRSLAVARLDFEVDAPPATGRSSA
jgi:hypothetical protein